MLGFPAKAPAVSMRDMGQAEGTHHTAHPQAATRYYMMEMPVTTTLTVKVKPRSLTKLCQPLQPGHNRAHAEHLQGKVNNRSGTPDSQSVQMMTTPLKCASNRQQCGALNETSKLPVDSALQCQQQTQAGIIYT